MASAGWQRYLQMAGREELRQRVVAEQQQALERASQERVMICINDRIDQTLRTPGESGLIAKLS